MEFILINDKNLKVILSENDLDFYNIAAQNLDYSTTRTKKALWDIFDKANEETGFNAADSKIFVRVFPSKDGSSCELFVTKIKKEYEQDLYDDYDKDEREEIEKYITSIFSKKRFSKFILIPYNTDALFSVCERLHKSSFEGSSRLYADDEKFYLVCEYKKRLPSYISDRKKHSDMEFPFISEYGELKKYNDENLTYIKEHFRCICDEFAVDKFSACI